MCIYEFASRGHVARHPYGASCGALMRWVIGHVGHDPFRDASSAVTPVDQPVVEAAIVYCPDSNRRRGEVSLSGVCLDGFDELITVHEVNMDFCPLTVNGLLSSGADCIPADSFQP